MRFIFFLFIISVSATSQKPFKWPGNKKAAIVLTYDDALQSQLNIAIPQLDSFQFKGTFFLTGNLTEKDIVRWRNAAKGGHELGNHTLYHPCRSSVISSVSRYQSENYNAAIILREISILNSFLFAIDSNSSRTYAYPCSETSVGGKDYTDTLKRSALIKYARSGGDSNSIVTDFNHLNKFVV
ncbi:MAG TPA: polysaccharide deacetylase family protein, partial [Segetibacter sp.]|nr:polysaccharide deacetylase family protein [Segetibacter sp.]